MSGRVPAEAVKSAKFLHPEVPLVLLEVATLETWWLNCSFSGRAASPICITATNRSTVLSAGIVYLYTTLWRRVSVIADSSRNSTVKWLVNAGLLDGIFFDFDFDFCKIFPGFSKKGPGFCHFLQKSKSKSSSKKFR